MKNEQGLKILVVDSDPTTAASVKDLMGELVNGIVVLQASNVEQALARLVEFSDIYKSKPFELIMADIFLQGRCTGLDLWSVIDETYPEVPFLVVSSLSRQEVLKNIDSQKQSHLKYLMKPFSKESFLYALSTLPKTVFSAIHDSLPRTLINSKDIHQQMTNMILLKLSVDWLEKQPGLDEPYGGQNQAQDLIFQSRLISKRLSDAFFSKNQSLQGFDRESIASNIVQLIELTPELKQFYNEHKQI